MPPVTVLANVAGISAPTPFEKITLEEWERIFTVNVRGTLSGADPVPKPHKAPPMGTSAVKRAY